MTLVACWQVKWDGSDRKYSYKIGADGAFDLLYAHALDEPEGAVNAALTRPDVGTTVKRGMSAVV